MSKVTITKKAKKTSQNKRALVDVPREYIRKYKSLGFDTAHGNGNRWMVYTKGDMEDAGIRDSYEYAFDWTEMNQWGNQVGSLIRDDLEVLLAEDDDPDYLRGQSYDWAFRDLSHAWADGYSEAVDEIERSRR